MLWAHSNVMVLANTLKKNTLSQISQQAFIPYLLSHIPYAVTLTRLGFSGFSQIPLTKSQSSFNQIILSYIN